MSRAQRPLSRAQRLAGPSNILRPTPMGAKKRVSFCAPTVLNLFPPNPSWGGSVQIPTNSRPLSPLSTSPLSVFVPPPTKTIKKGIGVSQLRKGAHASRPTAEHPAPTACASGATSCVSCLLIYRDTEEYPSFGFDPRLPPALRNPSQGAVKGAQAILRYSLFAPPPAESQCFAWLPGRCTLSALAFLPLPEAAA